MKNKYAKLLRKGIILIVLIPLLGILLIVIFHLAFWEWVSTDRSWKNIWREYNIFLHDIRRAFNK